MKKKNINSLRCPYCGASARLTVDRGIKSYQCACGARCKCYSDSNEPYGTLADARLRQLRCEAHDTFDQIWKMGFYNRSEAYRWLAIALGVPFQNCHIRNFGDFKCEETIRVSQRFLQTRAALAA